MGKAKGLLYWYQRALWYMQQGKGEISKPLQFWNETILILTFLSVRGIDISAKWAFFAYIMFFLLIVLFGVAIVKIGVVSYNTKLGNSQNPELLDIYERMKKVEISVNKIAEKLDEKHQ